MAYQVLARKYRPQFFRDVAGQDHVTRTLMNALAQGRIAHGYIFSGHRGIGKTTIARILAMALNCRTQIGSSQRPTPEPCGVCESCTEIRSGSAVDVIEIDAATNRGIDEIRELREAARYSPARDRYKIYILDEAHQITDAAFNALLKTLEEPPDHVIFMMATTEPENIPQTIRSRCQHFSFHAVKFDDILAQLTQIAVTEQVDAEPTALSLLAEAGDGSMRDALSIMDQAIASATFESGRAHLTAEQIRQLMGSVPNAVFERLIEAISENQSIPVLNEVDRLLNAGQSPQALARQFVRYLRNTLMARLGGEQTELLQISSDERSRVARSALLFGEEDLTRFLQIMLRTFDDLNYRQEQRFHLELGLLKLVHAQRLLPLEQLLSGVPVTTTPPKPPTRNTGSSSAPASTTGPAKPSNSIDRDLPASSTQAQSSSTAESLGSLSPFEADRLRRGGFSSETTTSIAETPLPRVESSAGNTPSASEPQTLASPSGAQVERTPQTGSSSAANTGEQIKPPVRQESHAAIPAPSSIAIAEAPEIAGARQPEKVGHIQMETEGSLARAVETLPSGVSSTQEASSTVSSLEKKAAEIASHLAQEASEAADFAEVEEPDPEEVQPQQASALQEASQFDTIRDRICDALESGGHNTAAMLIAQGNWSRQDGQVKVEVAARKTMLGLTMNPAAEKIVKQASKEVGLTTALIVLPGGSDMSGNGKPVTRVSSGAIQKEAMEHPIVKRAQELFKAEVLNVIDLRGKG